MGLKFSNLRFRVQSLEFGVAGLEVRLLGLQFRVQDLELRVCGVGSAISLKCLGFRALPETQWRPGDSKGLKTLF